MGLFDGSVTGSKVWAALARGLRRARSEEPLRIPIARGLSPGLIPRMTWAAKFRTTDICEMKERKRGVLWRVLP